MSQEEEREQLLLQLVCKLLQIPQINTSSLSDILPGYLQQIKSWLPQRISLLKNFYGINPEQDIQEAISELENRISSILSVYTPPIKQTVEKYLIRLDEEIAREIENKEKLNTLRTKKNWVDKIYQKGVVEQLERLQNHLKEKQTTRDVTKSYIEDLYFFLSALEKDQYTTLFCDSGFLATLKNYLFYVTILTAMETKHLFDNASFEEIKKNVDAELLIHIFCECLINSPKIAEQKNLMAFVVEHDDSFIEYCLDEFVSHYDGIPIHHIKALYATTSEERFTLLSSDSVYSTKYMDDFLKDVLKLIRSGILPDTQIEEFLKLDFPYETNIPQASSSVWDNVLTRFSEVIKTAPQPYQETQKAFAEICRDIRSQMHNTDLKTGVATEIAIVGAWKKILDRVEYKTPPRKPKQPPYIIKSSSPDESSNESPIYYWKEKRGLCLLPGYRDYFKNHGGKTPSSLFSKKESLPGTSILPEQEIQDPHIQTPKQQLLSWLNKSPTDLYPDMNENPIAFNTLLEFQPNVHHTQDSTSPHHLRQSPKRDASNLPTPPSKKILKL